MNWQAIAIHNPVARWLSQGATGRVLSVHTRSANLLLTGDRLLTLVTPELGAGPGTLVVEGRLPLRALGWQPGDLVRTDGSWLRAGTGSALRWADARPWEPPPPPALGGPETLRAGWEAMGQALAAVGRREGLLPAALQVAGRSPGPRADLSTPATPVTPATPATPVTSATPATPATPVTSATPATPATPANQTALSALALPRLATLLAAVDQPEMAPEAVRRLVGLGPGLTPSGDDLLAGFVYTLGRGGHPAAGHLAAAVQALPPAATATVSLHLLRWAAAGVVGEHATALVDTLLAGEGHGALRWLGPVLAHGATSGSDWAAGAWLALSTYLSGR